MSLRRLFVQNSCYLALESCRGQYLSKDSKKKVFTGISQICKKSTMRQIPQGHKINNTAQLGAKVDCEFWTYNSDNIDWLNPGKMF